jgi:proteasome-associated ATPase
MARRQGEPQNASEQIFEDIIGGTGAFRSQSDRVAGLAHLRASGVESASIDSVLIERIAQANHALRVVEQEHGNLREVISRLTSPPYYPAVFVAPANSGMVHGAIVQLENERRVVQLGTDVALECLLPGDEVFVSHERNCLLARSDNHSFLTGEIASYSRSTPDGRLVLVSREEELVVLPMASLRKEQLKAGDAIRFNRNAALAFEKIETSKGKEYFVESTPSDTFHEIGGLDREIERIKGLISLHILHGDVTSRYRLPRKKSVLMEGPPGNGKTKVARATCNWLGSLSRSGRSRFINLKPSGMSSMWHGVSEERCRTLFRIAREAAQDEPDVPVLIFIDEIDSLGASRGDSIHRIDDKILNAFMAELDGLEDRGNIVILAATNRMDALDPALLRAGRLGDLVLHFPQPRGKAARAILARHLPADIPFASYGAGPAATREALLDQAIAQIFAQTSDTELANVTLRDGKHRLVRAADLISGAQLQSIAQSAVERACVRDAEGGPSGVCAADMSAAVEEFFQSAPRALTPRNARNYLHDLPQDVDVVRVDPVERKVLQPIRYRVEAA